MVIVGGGVIAAEMAHIFSAFGTRVTIVAYTEHLLRHEDDDVSAAFTALASSRWDVHGRSGRRRRSSELPTACGCASRTPTATRTDHIDAEMVLIAVGRVPNSDRLGLDAAGIEVHDDGRIVVDDYQRTTVEGVFALGDVSSEWELKHVANHEARIVQYNLTHPDAMEKADHRFVPHAVFSDPQVASVGKTERELVEAGTAYVSKTQRYGDVAYGWAMEDTTGFVKVLADPASGQILGAHLLGADASSLIQPIVQAMSFGLSARDMGRKPVLDPPGARRSGRERRSRPSARLNPSSRPGSTGAQWLNPGRSRAHDPSPPGYVTGRTSPRGRTVLAERRTDRWRAPWRQESKPVGSPPTSRPGWTVFRGPSGTG